MVKRILTVTIFALVAAIGFGQAVATARDVLVQGNKAVSAEAIVAAMKVKVGRPFSSKELLDDEAAIRNLGFFQDVKVMSRPKSESEADVVVMVSEWPIVREVKVTGNTVLSTEKITDMATSIQEVGLVWNMRNARPIRDEITKEYESRGFLVQFDALGPDESSPGTLLISLVEPTVNEIKLIGLRRTEEKVIRRIMKTKPGGVFSARDWRRDIEELYYTYWFEPDQGVKPAIPEPTDAPGQYNLAIEFKEARTAMINAGVALDPQSRLVGTLSYSDSNFLGRGQNVGVQLSQATAGGGPSAEFAFGNRFYDAKDTSMNVTLFSRVVYNFTGSGTDPFGGGGRSDKFDERRSGGSVSFTRPLGDYRATLGLKGQNVRTIETSADPKIEFIQQDGDLVTLQLGVSHDLRRPSVEPYSGRLLSLLVEPSYSNVNRVGGVVSGFKNILGANFFLRNQIEYRQYWSRPVPDDTPLDKPRPVVALRVKYGFVSGDSPFFEQLFVGGADSLRGYPNQRFWGKQSLLGTLEYRYPVQRSFNIVAFTDYGGAWGGYGQLKDFPQSRRPDLRFGYGLGVAFRVPQLGSIRVDFAFNQEGGNRTHFSFGSNF